MGCELQGTAGLPGSPSKGPLYSRFGSKKIDRIVVFDAGDQQALGVVGIRRHDHFEAADVGEYPLRTLGMRLAAADAAPAGSANSHRCIEFPGAAIADARKLAHDLIETRVDVVRELNFGDGPQAVHAHADGRADDAALGNGSIDDAMLAVLALQSFRGAKHTAEITHVLTHDHHRRVLHEHDVHGGIQGLNHVHAGHGVSARPSGRVPRASSPAASAGARAFP